MLMRSVVVNSRIPLISNRSCKPTMHCFGRGLRIHCAGMVIDAGCCVSSGLKSSMRRDDKMAVQGGGESGEITKLRRGIREIRE